MFTKEHIDHLMQAQHAAVEELGAMLTMLLNAGGAGSNQPFSAAQGQQFNPQLAQGAQQAPQQQFQPQGQPQQQFAPQGQQQAPQQAQGGTVTSEQLMALLQSPTGPGKPNLVDDPAARPMLQSAMQQLGIASLPDAKPEQYAALHAAFTQIAAQLGGQGAPPQQQMGQQAPQQQFNPQVQQQYNPQAQQQFNPQAQQQFAPQQGYQQQPNMGGGLV